MREMQPSRSALQKGFITIETIAIIVIIVLVAVVAIAIVILPDKQLTQQVPTSPTEELPQEQIDPNKIGQSANSGAADAEFVPEGNINEITSPSDPTKPLNERLYDEAKEKIPAEIEPKISDQRFVGEVIEIKSTNPLQLEMKSFLDNSLNTLVKFEYPSTVNSKITYKGGTAESLAVGQTLYIDEVNNLDLNYPESIQSVVITIN